jgi:hypothetical protein
MAARMLLQKIVKTLLQRVAPLRVALVIALGTLFGCVTPTTIQSSWVDPTFNRGPFHRVAVVALFDTDSESRSFEEEAAHALEDHGANAVEAYTIVGDEHMLEQSELRAKLAEADVDAILIFRLIAVDERQYYRPPTPYLHMPGGTIRGDPFYWYYYPRPDFYSYWRSTWDVTHSPDYWQSHSFVVVESSFYDADKDQLVWTAKTETMDDEQFNATTESIVNRVTKKLVALHAVGPPRDDRTADNR